MPKLDQSRIDKIKQNVSLLNWVENEGHQPKKVGNDYVMSCIFHKDKTPSLKITPHKNLYHCFGCDASGSIIDWVMETQSLDFRTAVELIERQGVAEPISLPKVEAALSVSITESDQQTALQGVIDYYHAGLEQSPEAQAYLENRGLNHPELIKQFKLGFSNKTLSSTLAAKHTQTGQKQRQLLREVDVLKPSGYEHFAGCLTVPIYDRGNCVEIYGRRIQKYSDPKHLYLPGPHAGVWNFSGFKQTDQLIICEALIDAMTFWVNGFKSVTASYGTGGFTDEHLTQIKIHGIDKVLITYDRDQAGNKAAEALAKKLKVEGIHSYRVLFPQGMDANGYALQVTPADKSLALVIDKAEPMLDAPAINQAKNLATLAASDVVGLPPIPVTKQPEQSPLTVTGNDINLTCGKRHYRVRGLQNNTRLDQLKINLQVKCYARHHVDHLDLYQAKARQHYINQAANEIEIEAGIIKQDLGQLLLALEAHQEQTLSSQQPLVSAETALSTEAKKAALDLLSEKNLIQRITNDINTLGIIGEDSNALVGYLACVSRLLDKPLAIMIQSTSAAGKSALMDSVLSLMPDNQQHKFAAMTGQSLYYMGEMDLKHSILAIAEEEGAHTASYALKLLQSEGEVSIASTGKNEETGNLETKTYQVEGPVMLMMTTTAIDIDEELMNRCLVLSVNESREQTQAIHAMQRRKRTLAGLKQSIKKQGIIDSHHHAQALLKPLAVINPYAEHLTFLSDKTRTRRDHEKYLTLIDSITLLHQYQREIKQLIEGDRVTEYIEVTLDDIEIANQLAHDVLGKSLDELPPQTRKLLNLISDLVREACQEEKIVQSDYRFSRKQIRDVTGWGNTQLKLHCHRLEEMEYLLVHRGKRGQSYQYELLHNVEMSKGDQQLSGLIDVKCLQNLATDKKKSGVKVKKSPSSRPQVGGKSALSRGSKKAAKPVTTGLNGKSQTKQPELHL